MSYAGEAKYAEAIAAHQRFMSLDPPYPFIQALLGHVYAASGKRDEALAILGKLSNSKTYVSPTAVALIHIGLGDQDQALDSLDRAYAEHDVLLQYLKTMYRSIRYVRIRGSRA